MSHVIFVEFYYFLFFFSNCLSKRIPQQPIATYFKITKKKLLL